MKSIARKTTLLFLTALYSLFASAQDGDTKKVDVNLNVDKGGSAEWYTQPWVWIVGAAVFIILIVALTRNNSRSTE